MGGWGGFAAHMSRDAARCGGEEVRGGEAAAGARFALWPWQSLPSPLVKIEARDSRLSASFGGLFKPKFNGLNKRALHSEKYI